MFKKIPLLFLSLFLALLANKHSKAQIVYPDKATFDINNLSTLIDFEAGRPLELEALFYRPLAVARAKGLEAPRLTKLCSILTQMVNQTQSSSTSK